MHDSWHSAETAVAASLPTGGQDPQLISSAWRISNLSEIQATANGSSAIFGPEVNGSSAIFGLEVSGSSAIFSPEVNGSSAIFGPIVNGSSAIFGPEVNGSSAIFGPEVNGSSAIFGPEVKGSSAIFSPIVNGSSAIFDPEVNGSSAIFGPELAAAAHNRRNNTQYDEVANFSNEEVDRTKTGEQHHDKMATSSVSLQSPPLQPNGRNHNDFAYSVTLPFASKDAGSIPGRHMPDETEAGNQRPPDDALLVATGSCAASYAGGHVTGSEVNISSEKTGYMNLRHKSIRKSVQERSRPKRQAARDMCQPLKQWLYCHRDTPYPTKAEKQDLAHLSHMTLTQVSNWFANARRRLKNTVSGPEVTWRRRIKLYNRFVVGNQELLSISSDDTMWDEEAEEEEGVEEVRMDGRGKNGVDDDLHRPTVAHQMSSLGSSSSSGTGAELALSGRRRHLPPLTFDPETGDLSSPATTPPSGTYTPAKFKQGILQRYLTDACERVGQKGLEEVGEETEGDGEMREAEAMECRRQRNGSGSLSSHDYEEMSLSARSTPSKEHHASDDDAAEDRIHRVIISSKLGPTNDHDDLHWMEISAALALTNLAMRSRLNSGSSRASSRM